MHIDAGGLADGTAPAVGAYDVPGSQLLAARKADDLMGISTIGSYEDGEIVQPVLENTGIVFNIDASVHPQWKGITYAVNGKQYIAIVTGHGNPLASGIRDVIPETQLPPVNSSTLYVFALPDAE